MHGIYGHPCLEPVGSIQLGMGREVMMEGLRRVAALSAETAHMDAGLKFYRKEDK